MLTYFLWFPTPLTSLDGINRLVFRMDIGCILCEVETVDLCIPLVYMNASLRWVTHQNDKLWKWMLFVIDDIACTAEMLTPAANPPLCFRVYHTDVFPSLIFTEETLIIYIYIYIYI
jgi:hypothetical protein